MMVVHRTVTRQECPWLDADVPEGTEVFRYYGFDYGCVTPSGIAVTREPDVLPFFELPRSAVGWVDA